jgi:hypothetical protein
MRAGLSPQLVRGACALVTRAAVLLTLSGCASARTDGSPSPVASTFSVTPYPPAPWRVLSWAEKDAIVVWVSHILISHRDAEPDPFLRPAGWKPDGASSRTRAEALALAQRVSAEARVHPERFEALARQYSDDEVTRAAGGSLGGMHATQLPYQFVDALTALRPGEVSDIVPTSLGFHLLLRRMAPPKQMVAGRRIVVRYRGVPVEEDHVPMRSREEARLVAEQIASRARGSANLGDLVDANSEHRDRLLHGDIGTWSTVAPGYNGREVEALANLAIGAVGNPLDSVFGFQVLQRLEPPARRAYAGATLRLQFSATVPTSDPRSKPNVERTARGLAARLHRSPAAFTKNDDGHGAPTIETWEFGHGDPELTLALERLEVGEVGATPIEIPYFFIVAMRLDPALVAAPELAVTHELPARAAADLEEIFRNGESPALISHLTELEGPQVLAILALIPEEEREYRSSLDALKKSLVDAHTPAEREDAYARAQQRLHGALSAATYAKVMSVVQQVAVRALLSGS